MAADHSEAYEGSNGHAGEDDARMQIQDILEGLASRFLGNVIIVNVMVCCKLTSILITF